MTRLVISPVDDPTRIDDDTSNPAEITGRLAAMGIDFGRWDTPHELAPDATSEDVLEAYAAQVQAVRERGYDTVDVARMALDPSAPDYADKVAASRGTFLSEHRHADDEVRFFVDGSGLFYLHVDGQVLMLRCDARDFVSVPAGTPHWFDMGTHPRFTAIRFFQRSDGWVADFTDSDIATRFPSFDELAGAGA